MGTWELSIQDYISVLSKPTAPPSAKEEISRAESAIQEGKTGVILYFCEDGRTTIDFI